MSVICVYVVYACTRARALLLKVSFNIKGHSIKDVETKKEN
jgi:hypothetical protein